MGPTGPIGPSGPGSPAGPVAPVGPGGPAGPVGPVAPLGPPVTATLVLPRTTDEESFRRTKSRFEAASKGTGPLASTKTVKVAVSLVLSCSVTDGAACEVHCPVDAFVWQMDKASGKSTPPVSGAAVIIPPAPTFIVATEKAADAVVIGMVTMPSWLAVAFTAITSGTATADP